MTAALPRFELREYQKGIVRAILEKLRINIWADMGLGKTLPTLTAISILQLHGDLKRPVLIIAPKLVAKKTWPPEARKWPHLRHLKIISISGSPKDRQAALLRTADIYTINYENLAWLIHVCKDRWPFGMVVCDESTKLKGFRLRQGTFNAQQLSRIAFNARTERWVNLTGTPSANGLEHLWGQQWFIDGGAALGRTYTDYINRWFTTDYTGFKKIPIEGADKIIAERLSSTTITLKAKDYLELGDTVVTNIVVPLEASVIKLYKKFEKEMFLELNGFQIDAVNAAAKTIKCLQIASGAIYSDKQINAYEIVHDAKIKALEELHEGIGGKPMLVAYSFQHDLDRLLKAFPLGRKLTSKNLDEWNAGRIPLLFLHPASAGHGLNLQHGGHHICFFSQDWNLELYSQAVERIGAARQKQSGYARPVFVYHLVADGTIEQAVVMRRVGKQTVQDALRTWLGEIKQ